MADRIPSALEIARQDPFLRGATLASYMGAQEPPKKPVAPAAPAAVDSRVAEAQGARSGFWGTVDRGAGYVGSLGPAATGVAADVAGVVLTPFSADAAAAAERYSDQKYNQSANMRARGLAGNLSDYMAGTVNYDAEPAAFVPGAPAAPAAPARTTAGATMDKMFPTGRAAPREELRFSQPRVDPREQVFRDLSKLSISQYNKLFGARTNALDPAPTPGAKELGGMTLLDLINEDYALAVQRAQEAGDTNAYGAARNEYRNQLLQLMGGDPVAQMIFSNYMKSQGGE